MATQYHNPGLPSTLYTGGNVRFDTRQLGQMLYQEQKQREVTRQRELADLDGEMKSNVAKIRDADVPDFVAGFQDYANAKKRVLHDPSLKKDPQAYAAAQQEVAKKYGNAMRLANESIQARSLYEDVDKDRFKNPNNYVDDFYNVRKLQNQTPLSKLKQVPASVDPATGKPVFTDYSSPEVLLYKGQYDPTKLLNTARGEKLTNEVNEGPLDKTGLQEKVTTYQFYGSKPKEYKAMILNGMAGDRDANRFFSKQLSETTPGEIERVNKEYNAIPADVWKKMGVPKEELKIENPDSQADVAATYLAQKHALENMPRAIKSDLRTNEAVKMKMQHDWDREKMGISFNNAKKLIAERKVSDKGEADSILNGTMKELISEAEKHPIRITNSDGTETKTYNLPMSEEIAKAVMVPGEKYAPEAVRLVYRDGTPYIKRIVYKRDGSDADKIVKGKNGKPAIDDRLSTEMPLKLFRDRIGKELFTGKILYGEMGTPMNGEDYESEEEVVVPTTRSRNTKKHPALHHGEIVQVK